VYKKAKTSSLPPRGDTTTIESPALAECRTADFAVLCKIHSGFFNLYIHTCQNN